MPRGDRKPPGVPTRPDEFAPGIPKKREIKPLPRVSSKRPQEWEMATQVHQAQKAGPHTDLRLVDPKGRAHSWALPRGMTELPKPGERVKVIPQPTHTREYAARKGEFEIPKGYGAGRVKGSGLAPVEVVSRRPGVLRFNVHKGRGTEEFALVDTPKGQLLHNFTITQDSGVRGGGGHKIPQSKPKYRELRADSVTFDDPNQIHQAKIDGAHATFHLPARGKQLRAFSYRPTERETGVIEHTHRLPDHRALRAPQGLSGTVVRGELWAADRRGRALPAERIGGILNASVPKSRELQRRHGKLRGAIFDVVRYKGRDVESAPYERKLKMLKDVAKKTPFLELPPMAETPAAKRRLFAKIQAGKLKETKEGIVSWDRGSPRPTKVKFRPDVDAEVVGVFPGKGKHKGRAGGLEVRLPGSSATTRVGTGFTDRQREQLWKERDELAGRVAKVETQQVFESGKLRAPSFKEFHIEKGKQAAAGFTGHEYTHKGKTYSVPKLWALSKKLPSERLAVEDAQDYMRAGRAWSGGKSPKRVLATNDDSHGHMTRIRNADLRRPVIMAPHGGMADGLHRIAKATSQGKDTIRLRRFRNWEEMEPAVVKHASSPLSGLLKEATIDPEQVREGTPAAKSFTDFQRRLRPGDIVFTKPGAKGKSILSPLVAASDFLSGAKHPGWIHGAMYMGKGRVAHLDDKSLRRGQVIKREPQLGRDNIKLFDKSNYDLVALRPKSGAREAVKRMGKIVDTKAKIPIKKYLSNLLATGVMPSMGGEKPTDAVCTGLVGEAYKHAPLSKRRPLMMRPKDFLESKRVQHLVAFSRDRKNNG